MATPTDLFRQLGGFDESNFSVEFNDTDYCLRVHDQGFAVIYSPFATLYHFESKSRGFNKTKEEERRNLAERSLISVRWKKYVDRDPYYNPHFDRYSPPFSRLRHPAILAQPLPSPTHRLIDPTPWID